MNNKKVRAIIERYKQHFNPIHNAEIYKWRAVKCFQDNWNINAENFHEMLQRALARTANLLAAGNYYPARVLLGNAKANSEFIRNLFIDLFNEEKDLVERILEFRDSFKTFTKERLGEDKVDYQDHRAVLVYLCLRYPDRYFLFKYEILNNFVQLVDYPYQPKMGRIENVLQHLTLCNIFRQEVSRDKDLLDLHKNRLTGNEYFDSSFNILTQDIMYAAVRHIDKFESTTKQSPPSKRLIKVDVSLTPSPENISLKGSFTNYIENQKEEKRIGDLGELLVLQYEQERLKSLGIKKKPEHKSKSEGDGIGYDILSYDETGEEMFIEVKTTRSNMNAPFYITSNELERSKIDFGKFYLYRLFEFSDINNTAKYFKLQGDLMHLCTNPILYKVVPKTAN